MRWKCIDQLTYEDLHRSHVWEIRYEGEREMVRETDRREITDDPRRGFVVLTRYEFPDGTQGYGYSSPQDASGLDYIQPTIITDHGHWNVFTGENKPKKPEHLLFPLLCESTVMSDGIIWKEAIKKDPTIGRTLRLEDSPKSQP